MNQGLYAEKFLTDMANKALKDGTIWRASFTPEYLSAMDDVRLLMENSGLATRADPVGNLYGRMKGSNNETLLLGSHLDTVKNGGRYDGAAGVVLPILALKELAEEGFKPAKNVEIIAMFEEEGSRYRSSYLGSRIITGKMTDAELDEVDPAGVSIREAMRSCGYQPERISECVYPSASAFVELHIEQGPRLAASGCKIGIVENIVGLHSYEVTLHGKQNHAGTTPMNMRLDPVPEACRMILELTDYAKSLSDTAVLTCGRTITTPSSANVIAGSIMFSLDFRDSKADTINAIDQKIDELLSAVENKGFGVTLVKKTAESPCRLSPVIADAVEAAAAKLGLSSMRMNSGAGHDSQLIAESFPTGMVFLPSVNGISHSPDEYTTSEDLENGINILKELIISLAG